MATSSVKTCIKILAALVFFAAAPVYGTQCNVSTTGVNFGSYDILSSVPTDSTGSIIVSCNGNVPSVTILIGASPNSGTFWPRDMRSGLSPSYMLAYNLYADPGRSAVWGDGTLGTQTVIIQPVTKRTVYTETVYARIPAKQDIYYGPYSDSLTVTINW